MLRCIKQYQKQKSSSLSLETTTNNQQIQPDNNDNRNDSALNHLKRNIQQQVVEVYKKALNEAANKDNQNKQETPNMNESNDNAMSQFSISMDIKDESTDDDDIENRPLRKRNRRRVPFVDLTL